MKKILFALVTLIGTMSMNAQMMKIRKGNTVVVAFTAEQADSVVFEEEQTLTATGTAKATIDGAEVDVKWIQLWENGPKFAEYNVGAANNKAEDYGGYYAWGGSRNKGDDYNTGTSTLTGTNDTATKLWGSNWRMPTKAELEGLLSNCNVTWTDDYKETGIKGRIFTGKGEYKKSSVFLPAAGNCESNYVSLKNSEGYYWTSETPVKNRVYYMNFRSGSQSIGESSKSYDYSVRAVLAE